MYIHPGCPSSCAYCLYITSRWHWRASHPMEQRSKQLCFSQTCLDFCLGAFALNDESSPAWEQNGVCVFYWLLQSLGKKWILLRICFVCQCWKRIWCVKKRLYGCHDSSMCKRFLYLVTCFLSLYYGIKVVVLMRGLGSISCMPLSLAVCFSCVQCPGLCNSMFWVTWKKWSKQLWSRVKLFSLWAVQGGSLPDRRHAQ